MDFNFKNHDIQHYIKKGYMLQDRNEKDYRASDYCLVRSVYNRIPPVVDSQGYDTGADPSRDYGSSYPQKVGFGTVFTQPYTHDRLKFLEDIMESDSYYAKGLRIDYYTGTLTFYVFGYFNDGSRGREVPLYQYEWSNIDSDWYGAETFEASGCVGCQMQKPVSKDERAAIQKQVNKFNEQLALDPDDDFERYILLDLDDETLIEDAFFKRQGAWRPLTEAFRKRWGKRSELMDKISLAQVGEKSNYAIYSFEKPFWFEYECDPQDTATAEDPEGYGLGFEFDMTKEEAIEKARQIHKETKGAITMYNNARKRSGGGSTRIHPKFWATPEMMEEQKEYYKREDMEWPTGDALTDWSWEDKDEIFNVEFNEWADQELMSHGKDISFKDWAQDEGMKHGNTEITEWAQHEDESHDARYGAETFEAEGNTQWNKTLAMINQYDMRGSEGSDYSYSLEGKHKNELPPFFNKELVDKNWPKNEENIALIMDYCGDGVRSNGTYEGTLYVGPNISEEKVVKQLQDWGIDTSNHKTWKNFGYFSNDEKVRQEHPELKIYQFPIPNTSLCQWSNAYVRDTEYDDDGTAYTTFGQDCIKCGNQRRGTIGGDVSWDKNAETSGQWEIGEQLEEAQMNAERKKRSSLLSEPFEGTSLDSGEWKGILTGFGIGLLGLFGYSKLGK